MIDIINSSSHFYAIWLRPASLTSFYGTHMNDKTLFEPYTLGSMTLSNRVVTVPLTRNRAGSGFVPNGLSAIYYGQRASAGLAIFGALKFQDGASSPKPFTHSRRTL